MRSLFVNSFFVVLLSSAAFLTGCSGFESTSFPDSPAQASLGAIQGSVFGGHAPIVGAHVFVLEATSTGTAYAAKAKSLMSSTSTPANASFPVTMDAVTTSPTYGLYYVTTDANGAFNVSGDYTCDVNSPLYLYAAGGSTGNASTISITGISSTVSGGTYTYTFTANNTLAAGQTITFAGNSVSGEYATLNNSTQTAASATATSFTISTTTAPGTGTATQTGSVTAAVANPAIVNLAMLGVCSATIPSTLSFVFINEISTVAVAYGMSGFGTDGLHIGSSGTNLIGLQNATGNTGNLFDITGANIGSGSNGEGHIARSVTVNQNGTVPQAELDTLGNILATCVDSDNSAVSASMECTKLFGAATSNGLSTGTEPVDIAAAAFNIAHNPGTAGVVGLWTSPPKTAPFQPSLSSAPLDFTVAITYNNVTSPSGIAIDSAGNAYVATSAAASYVTKLSSTGVVSATSATGGNGFDSVAIDPSGNVWAVANNGGQAGALYAFTGSLGAVANSPFGSGNLHSPSFVSIDSSGFVYVTDGGNSTDTIQKFNNSGSLNTSLTDGCLTRVTAATLDTAGDLWATIPSSNGICRVSGSSNTQSFSGGVQMGTNVGIDSSGNGWVGQGSQTNLYKFTSGGGSTGYGVINNFAVGGLNNPTWVAIDGGNNIWLTNSGNSYALSEFNNSGVAITGSSGYQGTVLNKPSFLAIDGSGDVWVPNLNGNNVTELIGAAVPTVQPLSALKFGVKP